MVGSNNLNYYLSLIMIKITSKKINTALLKTLFTTENINLYMNYLAVVYALFLPISWKYRATIFSIILVLFIIRRNYLFYLKESFANPIVKAFLAYIFMHFLWLLGTENFQHATKMIKLSEYAIIPLIFLTFLTKEFANKVLIAFITSVMFSELLSYMIRFELIPQKLSIFNHKLYAAVAINDPSPFLLHMHYAVTLSIVCAILLFKLLSTQESLKVKIISIVFLLTATFNLTLVGGRSGYLSYIILLVTVIFLTYKKNILKPILLLSFFLTTIFFIAYELSPMFKNRIDYSVQTVNELQNNSNNYSSSFGTRLGLWKYALQASQDNILFGSGTGDQLDITHQAMPSSDDPIYQHLKEMHHLHSQYIQIYTEFGLIGLLIFLNIFYQILRYKKTDTTRKNILILITLAVMIALLTETFSSIYYLPLLSVLVSALIATKTEPKSTNSAIKDILIYIMITLFVFIITLI